jgi:hypothetical protein
MIVLSKQNRGYTSQRKYVQGKGFLDTLKTIGSYVSQNRDLIAKPLLGAAGNLAAFGVEEGGKALLNHLIQKSKVQPKAEVSKENKLTPTAEMILQNIVKNSEIPVTNIIGSGIRKFK